MYRVTSYTWLRCTYPDGLVDVSLVLVVVGVAEPLPPVAEVRGYHKAVGRILD